MKPRRFDAEHLDVAAFARDAGSAAGRFALDRFPRLIGALHVPAAPGAQVEWSIGGALRPQPGRPSLPELRLRLACELPLQCQRCLEPVAVPVTVERSFVFAADEIRAKELDDETEDDVLVLASRLDLAELIEDELILSLPLVPRHDRCSGPLPEDATEPAEPVPHPFAALAALKGRPTRH